MSVLEIIVYNHLQAGIVSLEAVMGHLGPADEAMAAAAKDAAAALAREIRGIGVISLSATAAEPVRGIRAATWFQGFGSISQDTPV